MAGSPSVSASSGAAAGKRAAMALAATVMATSATIAVFGDAAYLWIKAVHVIAIIAWMAGLLYLPRLFIYHCDAPQGSVQSETFKVMERRLLTIIMTPAMVIAWVLGLWLAYSGGHLASGWFYAKLALVLALSATHGQFAAAVRAFAEDRNDRDARGWRMINEIPTLLMIGIVILVIVKPF
ncbi:MAG: protoporphyrinogen oxidase HemJ [Hyphomicrobium sp.]